MSANAQQEKLPLREVLLFIESEYKVSFTYSDELVKNVSIDPIPETKKIETVLSFLRQQTGLTFTQLDERFITISKTDTVTLQVCATLIDDETNEKIVGATIQVRGKFIVSNSEGYFELSNLPKSSVLYIHSMGYERMQLAAVTLTGKNCSTLRLKQSTFYLSEVIISNYLTTGIRKRIDGSLSIQTQELGILPGLTEPAVLFTIQALPGIQSIDETVSNINVRGGTHDQNLVLWDGMKMYQQGHFFGLIAAFNPYATNEVNLVKNGTSAAYSDGVSSTIDIRSDDEVTPALSGGIGINMLDANAQLKIPISDKLALHVSGRESIAGLLETPTYRAYYDRAFRDTDVTSHANDSVETDEQFNFYDISAKLLYDVSDKDKLRVSFLQIHNQIEYEETEKIGGQPESKTSSLEQENLAGGISYSRLWNARLRTSAQGYISRYELKAINNDILNEQRLTQQNEVLDMGIKIDARISLSRQLDLNTGYQFFEVGVSNLEDINTPPYFRQKKTVLRTHVVFTEAGYTSRSTRTNIRAGLRANYFALFNRVKVEPRITFHHQLSGALTLEVLGEMKSQTTTQIIDYQNDFLGVEKRRWVMSNNDDIPIISSQQLSVGFHYQKKDVLISLEGYGKWVDHILTSSQGFQNQFQYVRSAGSYHTSGLDFLLNHRFSKFNSWLSYSFAQSTYAFPELIPSTFPSNLDIRHRATGGVGYQSDHLDFSCGINWHTGKPYTKPLDTINDDGPIAYHDPNTTRLDNYLRLDISATYKITLSPGLRGLIGISIWNLLDQNNIIDAYYQTNAADEIILSQRKALGFTPNVMLRIEF